jgi:hypothetical protein
MDSLICKSCDKQFSRKQTFDKHTLNQACIVKLNVFKCNCGKEYKSVKWYDKHIITCDNKGNQKVTKR